MKKSTIKKMDENELTMMVNIASIDPFDAMSIMIRKGDIEKIIPSRPGHNGVEDDWNIPMKNMTRQERRKATFRKDKGRQNRAAKLGYNLSPDMNNKQVKDLLSSNHADRMYFRGSKAQKKLGKAMSTKEGLNLMAQIEREAEEDREIERKEVERQFMLDELASTTDDLQRLEFVEMEAKKAVAELIRTIYEANGKLVDYQAKINGLKAAEEVLRKKISKLEEAVNS